MLRLGRHASQLVRMCYGDGRYDAHGISLVASQPTPLKIQTETNSEHELYPTGCRVIKVPAACELHNVRRLKGLRRAQYRGACGRGNRLVIIGS